MTKFTDTKGRVWEVEVTVGVVRRLRALLNIDIYKLAEDGLQGLAGLVNDPCQLCDILFVVCQRQADEKHKVSDIDFGESLAGDSIEQAADAFIGALIDFFPQPRVREALKSVLKASKDVAEKVGEKMLSQVRAETDAINPEALATEMIAGMIDRLKARKSNSENNPPLTSTDSFGNSRE